MSYEKLSDAAASAVVWSLISDVAAERKDEARQWLAEHMGDDAAAVKAVANGEDIGRATWVEPKPKPVIVNPNVFLQFVSEHYPEDIVRSVNPAFQKALLSGFGQPHGALKEVGGVLVDANGVPVPGVEVRKPAPYIAVKKADSAREVVEQLLDGGRLSLEGITQPELEAGEA